MRNGYRYLSLIKHWLWIILKWKEFMLMKKAWKTILLE